MMPVSTRCFWPHRFPGAARSSNMSAASIASTKANVKSWFTIMWTTRSRFSRGCIPRESAGMRPSVTPSGPMSDNRAVVRLEAVSRSEPFCRSEIGRCEQTEIIRRSPAPLFSLANSQFFRALSCDCPAKLPGSAPFPWVFRLGIETVVQGQMTLPDGLALSQVPRLPSV